MFFCPELSSCEFPTVEFSDRADRWLQEWQKNLFFLSNKNSGWPISHSPGNRDTFWPPELIRANQLGGNTWGIAIAASTSSQHLYNPIFFLHIIKDRYSRVLPLWRSPMPSNAHQGFTQPFSVGLALGNTLPILKKQLNAYLKNIPQDGKLAALQDHKLSSCITE